MAFGAFIGGSPGDCPAQAPRCDDGDPFTADTCDATAGCRHEQLTGVPAVRAGVDFLTARLQQPALDGLAQVVRLRAELPALQGAVGGLATGQHDSSRALLRRGLGRLAAELRRAARQGLLGADGSRLLDVARETRLRVQRLR